MKVDWNKRYTTIAIYAFIVICCSLVFFNILDKMSAFTDSLGWMLSTLQPFIIGFVIAYLLNFILVFIEEKAFVHDKVKNLSKGAKRGISILLTYIIASIIMYLFIQFVLPQVVDSIVGIVNDIPTYIANVTSFIEEISQRFDLNNEYVGMAIEKWNEFINYAINVITNLIPVLANTVKTVASSLWNIILGIIISVYMLIDKERFSASTKKVVYAVFSRQSADKIVELGNRSNDTFGKFLSGKIIDSVIIGILTFIILTVTKMPFTILVSVIIGITNIIPFFGPFLGAIPSVIIIMFVSPVKALWFILIIIIIQQLDGNIIGPKILGDSIGISAFWILFSILVAGKLLGLAGMIIGVPLFAIIYSIVKEVVEARLAKKGLPKETKDYM
ncbi:MAG: AI-2E family transporter [Peptostreptococcaceae bacterium]